MDKQVRQILRSRVYDVAIKSPLDPAPQLSRELGAKVFLKREDLQPVKSFKLRGAYNKISHLSEEEKQAGVICASAGNHAQGVALSAQKLGIRAVIVMPLTTPTIKIEAVKSYGAEVVLYGDTYNEAATYSKELQKQENLTYIHPFDDELVIAGQGTIGQEILEQAPNTDYIFVPVGGGGLIAGIASYVKNLNPDVKIIGIEPVDADAMKRSIAAGKRIELERVGNFADGVAVKYVGEHTFELCRRYVDEIITVSTDETCSAIRDIFNDTRSIVEPAGALAVAGMKVYAETTDVEGKTLVAISSGANMNFERLQFVAERTLTGSHAEALYAINLAEKPGALKKLVNEVIGSHSITEFNYRKSSTTKAHIFLGISTINKGDKQALEQALSTQGYEYTDLTDNDFAKDHLRHMIGGKGIDPHERVYEFKFPERAGALSDFLEKMPKNWNISLFHYRSRGSNVAKVLIGLEGVTDPQFEKFSKNVGFSSTRIDTDPVFRIFL